MSAERALPRRCRNPDCTLCYESPRDQFIAEPSKTWLCRLTWVISIAANTVFWTATGFGLFWWLFVDRSNLP